MSNSDSPHIPIRVSTLRGDLKIPFDVYILVAGKYIHYCRAGESFEGKRLERLKAKKLKKMFIRKDDDIAYRQYLEQSIDTAYKDSGRDMQTRVEVIQGFQQATAETFIEDPLDKFSYEMARSSVQRFTEFIETNPEALKAVLELKNTDMNIIHHGFTVAAIAVAIAQEQNLRTGAPLHLLALGCLLHDIEHYHSDLKVGRPLSAFSKEELESYKSHPWTGAHRLEKSTFVDQLVMNIIIQHEEHINGDGFPKGLREKDMDPLVLVAATANAYDRLICFEGMNLKDALKAMMIDKLGTFPLPYLMSLQRILKKIRVV